MQFGFISRLLNKIRGDKTSTTSPDQPNAASDPETTSPKSSSRRSRRKSASTAQPGTDDTTAQAPEKKRPPRKKRTGQKDRAAARSGSDRAAAQERRRDGDSGRTPVANIKPRDSVPSMDGWTAPAGERRSPDEKLFQDLNLDPRLLRAIVDDLKFRICSPIQAAALPNLLAGRDLAGRAQTGTGKTAAFLITILQRFLTQPQRDRAPWQPMAIVLAPTRELALQIAKDADDLSAYCPFATVAVYGGMDYDRQKREMTAAPVDLLVATPGRLLDFVRSRVVDLSKVDTLVIDEADRMLDMGFIPDVRSIMNRLPPKNKRCTMLYSATLDDAVMRLASQWMEAPVKIEVESEQVTTKTVKQIVYVVTANEKFTVLYNLIQQYPESRMLIFCNRRNTTDDVAEGLARRGVRCEVLSGDVNQNRRLRVLEDFRDGKIRTVVATDVAGRGLHVDDIGFVVNFDFPYEPEDYVHRIGRTGRAGHTGTAISFADEDESFIIPDIEKFIGEELKCTVLRSDDPLLAKLPPSSSRREGGRSRREKPRNGQRQEPASADRPQRETAAAPRDTEKRVSQKKEAERAAPKAEPEPKSKKPEPAVAPRRKAPAKPAVRSREAKPAAAPTPAPQRTSAVVPAQPTALTLRRAPRFSEEWVPGEK